VGSSTGQFLLCDPFQLQQSDTEFHQVRQPGMPEARYTYIYSTNACASPQDVSFPALCIL
jgi:hypothetical protein